MRPRSSTVTSLLCTRSDPGGTSGMKYATSRNACGREMSTMRSPWANHATGISLLVTISHDNFADGPIRVSSDPTARITETDTELIYGTVSRGSNYLFYPFSLKLPSDEEDGAPKTAIVIDNVSRWLTEAVESIDPRDPVTIDLEVVLSTSPDTVEVSYSDFTLKNVDYDMFEVSGEISMDALFGEPVPAHRMTPGWFPGVHDAG